MPWLSCKAPTCRQESLVFYFLLGLGKNPKIMLAIVSFRRPAKGWMIFSLNLDAKLHEKNGEATRQGLTARKAQVLTLTSISCRRAFRPCPVMLDVTTASGSGSFCFFLKDCILTNITHLAPHCVFYRVILSVAFLSLQAPGQGD